MKRIFYVVLSVVLFASFLLTACGTPATEVPSEPVAPEATEAPAPTDVPAPTFSGTATITFVQEPDNLNREILRCIGTEHATADEDKDYVHAGNDECEFSDCHNVPNKVGIGRLKNRKV